MENIIIEKNKLNIISLGIDFSNDFAQMAIIVEGENEPKSISVRSDEDNFLIPTAIFKDENTNTFYIGEDAIFHSQNKEGLIKNILTKSLENEENELLIQIYIKKMLEIVQRNYDFLEDMEIVVTVENADKEHIELITNALVKNDIKNKKIRVISHSEAFIYYTVNQKKELWLNDTLLFDFDEKHFTYRRLNENKNRNPKIITVTEEDLSMDIPFYLLSSEDGKKKADKKFLEIIQQELRKHIVSTVYLTGIGFYEEWSRESLTEILKKRRVFKGYNLFVKGAAYSALKRYNKIVKIEHLFNCEGRTKASIGLLIEDHGKNRVITLSKAGTNWYEAGAMTECIVDNVDKVQFVINTLADNFTHNVMVDLKDFPKRPNKTTRIKINLAFRDDDKFDIQIKDLGFGEFFKSSEKIIKRTISISELF